MSGSKIGQQEQFSKFDKHNGLDLNFKINIFSFRTLSKIRCEIEDKLLKRRNRTKKCHLLIHFYR